MTENLVLEEIQGLSVFGYNLPFFRFLFARIDAPEAGQAWLRQVLPEVTMGRRPGDKPATCLNVAFTARGLAALGLDEAALATFDEAFREGIESRAELLGDTGDSHPSKWTGGLGTPDVHAVLMLFAADRGELDTRVQRHLGLMEATHGVEKLSEQEGAALEPKEDKREHFGFRDGLTRVILEGTGAAPGQPLTKPGEFILGHEDESGAKPGEGNALLCDGTYMVYRKIYEDVATWRTWLAECSTRLKMDPELLAAKAMGRWPDGAPLALAPDKESQKLFADGSTSTDFLYGELDPAGMRCPFGSHVRRANPRDDPSNGGSKRHLLMRRGLPYGLPLPPGQLADDGKDRGLIGVFVNASITRQFEHVQRLWINDPKMRGRTVNDKDPIAGDNDGRFDFSMPAKPFAKRLRGLPRFTKVCGGAYLFAPGAKALALLAKTEVRPSPPKEPAVITEPPSGTPAPGQPAGTAQTPPTPTANPSAAPPAPAPPTASQPPQAPPADVHSYLTTIATIKPGQVETLKRVLAGIAKRPPNQGALALIGTVHFARWAIIDGGTRLLFTSNFDGNLDDYLEDFIREGTQGLDAVWGNCEGYPSGGAADKEGFKRFVADMAVENALCYSAYPDATLPEVTSALRARRKFMEFVEEFQA